MAIMLALEAICKNEIRRSICDNHGNLSRIW